MAIQSTKHIDENPRTVSPKQQEIDILAEISLRPKKLDEYIGQKQMKGHLKVAIESAKIRKTPLEHILFYGPPGLGKTTISTIIAHEM
jgi:holliday junction ATP-dependent DNA helicase ruvB